MSERKKILLVTERPRIAWRTVRYSARLAELLEYELVGLYVQSRERGASQGSLFGAGKSFAEKARSNASAITKRLNRRGVRFEYLATSGPIGAAVDAFQHHARRVEFVLQEVPAGAGAPPLDVSVPVYCFERGLLPWLTEMLARGSRPGGMRLSFLKHLTARRRTMATGTQASKKSCAGKMVVALTGAAAIYAGLFANEGLVTSTFTKGGLYATLPILTAFLFSFVYSAFAHNFWALLGIEAHHKTQQPRKSKTPTTRKDTRPRPTLTT